MILRKIEVGLKTREIAFDDGKSGRSMADAGAPHTGSNSNQNGGQVFDLRWRISGHHWDKTPLDLEEHVTHDSNRSNPSQVPQLHGSWPN